MKKLLAIAVLGLLWSASAYANDIILNCKLLNLTTYYEGGKAEPSSRSDMLKTGFNMDQKYLINFNKKKILQEGKFSKEFEPIKSEFNDVTTNWNDMNVNWVITYNHEDMKGQSRTYNLDRTTGLLEETILYSKGNNIRKAIKTTMMKTNYNCEVAKKKF